MLHEIMNLNFSKRCVALVLTLTTIIGGLCVSNIWKSMAGRIHMTRLRKIKQKRNLASKEKVGRDATNYSDQAKRICNMNIEDLIKYLKEDRNNYKIAFKAFQSKAYIEDQRLNCVIEFIDLDVSEVDLNGPFAGLPISIKDNVMMKGYQTLLGCAKFVNDPPADESCVLLRALQKLGAVPFVKSIAAQTTMTVFSSNPIDGLPKNPQNVNLSPGGSSSGEGVLIGSKASIIGFGADIAGSVRIPAAFCGVVGLKPTVDRMSMVGDFPIGFPTLVRSTYGPLCRDVASCAFVLKNLFDSGYMSDLDPIVPRVPFSDEDYGKKKLKIGYFTFDGSYHVMPFMRRAVNEAVEKLRKQGHEVIPWQPPFNGRKWFTMYMRALTVDGCQAVKDAVKYDEVDDCLMYKLFHIDHNCWAELYNRIKYMLPGWIVDRDKKIFYKCCTEKMSVTECFALTAEIESFKRDLISDWTDKGLDGVVCPAGGFTAFPLKFDAFMSPLCTYSFLWNMVNFPAGTIPVTKVLREDINELKTNSLYKSSVMLREVSMLQMDTEGLSVSVMCAGLPFKEELCLNVMRQLELGK